MPLFLTFLLKNWKLSLAGLAGVGMAIAMGWQGLQISKLKTKLADSRNNTQIQRMAKEQAQSNVKKLQDAVKAAKKQTLENKRLAEESARKAGADAVGVLKERRPSVPTPDVQGLNNWLEVN